MCIVGVTENVEAHTQILAHISQQAHTLKNLQMLYHIVSCDHVMDN